MRSDEGEKMHALGLAFWNGKPATTPEFARAAFEKTAAEFKAGRCLHWVAESKVDRSIVGCVGFYRSFENDQGEVGYVIAAPFRGLGIMTELLPRLLDYGFRERALKRIIAVTHGENAPSIALLARFGFVYESDREDGYRLFARTPLA